jgi:serine/threonine protein kinase/WD40 repeat protein
MSEPASISESEQERLFEQACADLEQAVRDGRGRAEDILARYPWSAEDAQSAVGLIYREFSVRSDLGEQPSPQEYYERFPAYRRDLEVQFQIHAFLAEACAATDGDDATAPVQIGPYTIEAEIGRGAVGVVYRARHHLLDRKVALKILSPSLLRAEESDRFLTEARAVARLQHPNIVQLFEVGASDGRPYLALELVAGGNLAQAVAAKALSQRAAAELTAVVGRALAYSHSHGILHRDLKPGNILLTAEGVPKIADFGLSKLMDRVDGTTQVGAVIGTPEYMAPEQIGAVGTVGVPADLYGLGAILYELLTGRPPFRAETQVKTLYQVTWYELVPVLRLQPDVAPDLAVICEKCLAKNPAQRYATAAELADDLDRFLSGKPILARPPSVSVRLRKWAARNPLYVVLASVVLLASGALVTLGAWSNTRLRLAAADANQQRHAAEASAEQARSQLETARRLNYSLQIGQVNELWRTDPRQAMQLLRDPEVCPPEMRDFSWGLFHHLCRADYVLPVADMGGVTALAVSADGRRLAIAGPTTVQQWQCGADQPQLQSSAECAAELAVAWGSDGRLLTAGTRGPVVVVDGWLDEARTAELSGHIERPTSASFSADGMLLATGGFDSSVCLWRRGEVHPQAILRFKGRVLDLALSADGRVLLLSLSGGTQQTYDLGNPQEPREIISGQALDGESTSAVVLSRDGSMAAAAENRRRSIVVFNPHTGARRATLWGPTDLVETLEFSPDGRFLAGGGRDHLVRVWSVDGGAPLATLANSGRRVRTLRFLADGTRLVAGGDADDVQVFGLADRFDLETDGAATATASRITAVACSPNGATVAAGTSDGHIRFHRAENFAEVKSQKIHDGNVYVVTYSPDGRRVATGGDDGRVGLVDLSDGRTTILAENAGRIRSVAFNADGTQIAAGCGDGAVKVWNARSAEEVQGMSGGGVSADVVAYSPDGRWLAVGYLDSRLQIVDTKTLLPVTTLFEHHDRVLLARFSPDGRSLVTGGLDRTVLLWDLPDFTLRTALRWREGYPFCAAFTPDGRTLAVGGGNRSEPFSEGEVVLWDVATGHLRANLPHQIGPIEFLQHDRSLITVDGGKRLKRWIADRADATEVKP